MPKVQIMMIQAIKVGSDAVNGDKDDTYIQIGGTTVYSHQFAAADIIPDKKKRENNEPLASQEFNGETTVNLFDKDDSSDDDFLGGFIISESDVEYDINHVENISGSGSAYQVHYRITK